MKKAGVIAGTALRGAFQGSILEIDTLHGRVKYMYTTTEPRLVVIPRHGFREHIPSNMVNYKAIISALQHHGVEYVFSTILGTRLTDEYRVGDIVIPNDVIDLTKSRQTTLFIDEARTIDTSQLFSEKMRKIIIEELGKTGLRIHSEGVVVVTEGPRPETPAEARMYRMLGGTLVSTSLAPEVFMAREAGMEYVAIAIIVNKAADEGGKIPWDKVSSLLEELKPMLREAILRSAQRLLSGNE